MTEIKPGSRLPWKIDARPFASHGKFHISCGDYIVGTAMGQMSSCETEAEANAAYIVTACNAYPSLLNGLREAREALEAAREAVFGLAGNEPLKHDWHPDHTLCRAWRAEKNARSTLAHLDTLLAQEGEG